MVQFWTVKVRMGVELPKLSDVSLLLHLPFLARQAGVGVYVPVSVTVGVLVGVNVGVGVDVLVGVKVGVDVGVSVGPNNCPGPQAERDTPDKSDKMIATRSFVLI